MRKHNSLLTSIATSFAILLIVGLLFVSIPTPVVSHTQYETATGTRTRIERLYYEEKELRCIDGVYQLRVVRSGYKDVVVTETYSYTYEVEHEHSLWDRVSQTIRDVGEAAGNLIDKVKPW